MRFAWIEGFVLGKNGRIELKIIKKKPKITKAVFE